MCARLHLCAVHLPALAFCTRSTPPASCQGHQNDLDKHPFAYLLTHPALLALLPVVSRAPPHAHTQAQAQRPAKKPLPSKPLFSRHPTLPGRNGDGPRGPPVAPELAQAQQPPLPLALPPRGRVPRGHGCRRGRGGRAPRARGGRGGRGGAPTRKWHERHRHHERWRRRVRPGARTPRVVGVEDGAARCEAAWPWPRRPQAKKLVWPPLCAWHECTTHPQCCRSRRGTLMRFPCCFIGHAAGVTFIRVSSGTCASHGRSTVSCHVGQTILCACMYMHAALPMSAPEFPMARRQRQHDVTCVSYTYYVVVRYGLATGVVT